MIRSPQDAVTKSDLESTPDLEHLPLDESKGSGIPGPFSIGVQKVAAALRKHPSIVFSVLIFTILVCFFLWVHHACMSFGLYMDAINPEYLVARILGPSPPVTPAWFLPGNQLGKSLPVLAGSIYHGTTQLYAALPFFYVFGISLTTFRAIEAFYACVIVALMALNLRQAGTSRLATLSVVLLLCVNPAYFYTFGTQGYSNTWPMVLFLSALSIAGYGGAERHRLLRALVSGGLMGLACFSYFQYFFFLPAYAVHLLIIASPPRSERSRIRVGLAATVGLGVGYSPLIAGVLLARDSLGGTSNLIHWFHKSTAALQVAGTQHSISSRIASALTFFAHAATASWHSKMLLHKDVTAGLGTWPLVAVGLFIFAGFVFSRPRSKLTDSYKVHFGFVGMFLFFGSMLGNRLGGHHYTALVPLVYVCLGLSIEICTRRVQSSRRPRLGLLTGSLTAIAGLSIFVGSVATARPLRRALQRTGGEGLYSSAILSFASRALQIHQKSVFVFQDWGLFMPFEFLTRGGLRMALRFDSKVASRWLCKGQSVSVGFIGPGWQKRMNASPRLMPSWPIPRFSIYTDRLGTPVFGVATFGPLIDAGERRTLCPHG